MYVTTRLDKKTDEQFDWQQYFKHGDVSVSDEILLLIIKSLRETYKEHPLKMAFTMTVMMRQLLTDLFPAQPSVIELGAATGFLSRWLLEEFGGKALLVDNNPNSKIAFEQALGQFSSELPIHYLEADVFSLNRPAEYDIACSFGLIEHFKDKTPIINAHAKCVKPDGYMILLAPYESELSKIYWKIHPELNLGYRELLSEKDLRQAVETAGHEVLNIQISEGYVYDFVGAVCKVLCTND